MSDESSTQEKENNNNDDVQYEFKYVVVGIIVIGFVLIGGLFVGASVIDFDDTNSSNNTTDVKTPVTETPNKTLTYEGYFVVTIYNDSRRDFPEYQPIPYEAKIVYSDEVYVSGDNITVEFEDKGESTFVEYEVTVNNNKTVTKQTKVIQGETTKIEVFISDDQ